MSNFAPPASASHNERCINSYPQHPREEIDPTIHWAPVHSLGSTNDRPKGMEIQAFICSVPTTDSPAVYLTQMEHNLLRQIQSRPDPIKQSMADRLRRMSRDTVESVTRAWIRGLCPQKPIWFPYSKQHRAPGWWPHTSICPHLPCDRLTFNGKS